MNNLSLTPIVSIESTKDVPPHIVDLSTNYRYNNLPYLLYDSDAINNEIWNIFSTMPGDRIFQPLFGCMALYRLWDPCDEILAWQLETDFIEALRLWMPHLIILQAPGGRYVTLYPQYRAVEVNIPWRFRQNNVTGRVLFSLMAPGS